MDRLGIDGFLVLPGTETGSWAGDLDALAELGVPRINVVSLDPDLSWGSAAGGRRRDRSRR